VAIYELFDRQSANQIGTYETIAEALGVVRTALHRGAASDLETVSLGVEDEDGNTWVIAAGEQLIETAIRGLPSSVTMESASAQVHNGSIVGTRMQHPNVGYALSGHGA